MLQIEYVYWLCGIVLAACGVADLRAGRLAFAAFWGILALCFLGGDLVQSAAKAGNALPAQLVGAGVIVLALIAGSGKLRRGPSVDIDQLKARLGNRLFIPALVIPFGTLALILLQPYLHFGDVALFDARQSTLIALALACTLSVIAALALTRAKPIMAIEQGGRLLDTLSWAALLPMLLATLGAVFAATGVGDAIAHITTVLIPTESRLTCLLAYALGMALFTMIMGNAFAAFPVLTAGIGLPLLVVQHHANPAALGALGMLSGYCGTLLTPMAANFNVVPVALLELRDPNAVIRAQWPTAVCLFVVNLLIMDFVAFR